MSDPDAGFLLSDRDILRTLDHVTTARHRGKRGGEEHRDAWVYPFHVRKACEGAAARLRGFLRPDSSTVEQAPDEREMEGSTPSPATKEGAT